MSRQRVALGLVLAACMLCAVAVSADELRGVVRGEDGSVVGGADFDIYDLAGNKLTPSDNSDASGQYQLVTEPGTFDVLVQPPAFSGWAPQWQRGITVLGIVQRDWTLRPSARVLGFANAASGRPIAAADLDFDRSSDGTRMPVLGNLSSSFGTFAVVVEQGTYTITATPPESTGLAPQRVFDWTVPTTEPLEFRFENAVRLDGIARDAAGQPLEGARWSFTLVADGMRVPAAENRSGTDGRYRVRVAPGQYDITLSARPGERLAARRLLDVDLSGDRTLDTTLEPGWFVSGTVRDSHGVALANASWSAVALATGATVPTPDDRSDASGRYRLTLAPGSYRLTLVPPAGSGLPPRVIEPVIVAGDRELDVAYGSAPSPERVAWSPVANPTYRTARLRLALPQEQDVIVELFDASGRRVRELVRSRLPAGESVLSWDGRNAGGGPAHTGVYFARAIVAGRAVVTRFVLLPRP